MKKILILIAFCYSTNLLFAADVVAVLPLTNKILMVQFDEGYAIFHKSGQKRSDESMVVDTLNAAKASLLTSYSLISTDDATYATAKNPTDLGRKAKGTSFAHLCQGWGGTNVGCVNTSIDHAKEHWIYLFLPEALQSGKTYTLKWGDLAKNKTEITFKFDETVIRSEAIHVNNIGYVPSAAQKFGYISHWLGSKGGLDAAAYANKNFKLINQANKTVAFTGKVVFRKNKSNVETSQTSDTPNQNFASADVYECNFSTFTTPGEYVLSVDEMGCSFPFKIDADVYREPYFWTMKGLYHNRSGIALLAKHTDWPRPAPHNPKSTPGFAQKLKYTSSRYFDWSNSDNDAKDKPTIEAAAKGTLTETFGWYQDAGDWDTYFSHSWIPSDLMWVYESARDKFTDNELNIPESGNGIPDILDEAFWQMRFYKRAKDEIKSKGWGTGGVPGARVMGDLWGGDTENDITRGSWQDTREWYVSGEDPWMSYKYAGLAAQMHYILASENKKDTEGVDWLKEAVDAYNWAKKNTKNGDENKKFDFLFLKDVRAYAAVALYRATGEAKFHDQFLADATSSLTEQSIDGGRKDLVAAAFIYTTMPKNRATNSTVSSNAKAGILTAADNEVTQSAEKRACRWGGNMSFPMLVGQPTTPMVQIGVMAHALTKSANYLTALQTTSDYFLGTNPLSMTWISGVGERHPVQPFHMDWFYSTNPNNVIKGIVPYGPWRVEAFQDQNRGPWFDSWAYRTVFPTDIKNWPGHERWFDQRYGLFASEFTVHQNTVVAATVYGFLTNDKEKKTIVELPSITPTEDFASGLDTQFTVFPNPASSTLNVNILDKALTVKQIRLLDITGKYIQTLNFKNTTSTIEINVKDYPPALYQLEITLDNGTMIAKKVTIVR